MKREIERYMELMKERPEEFVNSDMIEIEKDPEKIALAAEKLDRPVGVVYESQYHLMVVDVCIGNNGYYTYERILPKVRKNAVVILLQAGDCFVLLKQYRHALRDWQYSFPRGFADEHLSVEENAIKELTEETGCQIQSIRYLGTTVADSGLAGTKVSIFHAVGSDPSVKYGNEGISGITFLSLDEIKKWIKSGKITDGFTLSAMMMYLTYSHD